MKGNDRGSCHELIGAFQIVFAMTKGFKSFNDVQPVETCRLSSHINFVATYVIGIESTSISISTPRHIYSIFQTYLSEPIYISSDVGRG